MKPIPLKLQRLTKAEQRRFTGGWMAFIEDAFAKGRITEAQMNQELKMLAQLFEQLHPTFPLKELK